MQLSKNYNLIKIVVPLVSTNCYFLVLNRDAILIDAAGDTELIDYIKNHNLDLKTILLTHGHYDHIEGLNNLCKEFPEVNIYAQENEKVVIENKKNNLMNYDLDKLVLEKIVYTGDAYSINTIGLKIDVLHTPGHTVGSTCYYIKELNLLFSGDTLFRESYGRTDLPTGNMKSIAKSVASKIMTLNDDLQIYPGHGESTNLFYEKQHNEIMRDYVIDWAFSKE